jgi:hypothetical protein
MTPRPLVIASAPRNSLINDNYFCRPTTITSASTDQVGLLGIHRGLE